MDSPVYYTFPAQRECKRPCFVSRPAHSVEFLGNLVRGLPDGNTHSRPATREIFAHRIKNKCCLRGSRCRAVVDRYINKLRIRNLRIYLDPNSYVAFHDNDDKRNAPFALYGMPVTYAIAVSGRIVGYMPGAADWTSDATGNLIEFLYNS